MPNKFRLRSKESSEKKEFFKKTLEISSHYAGELSIEVLPIEKIELDPENQRELSLTLSDAIHGINKSDVDYDQKRKDWKSLESLSKTIKKGQLINPIYVYRFGNKCRLISGERRTLASAIAGKKEVIARIASQRPVGTELRVLQWVENNERSDLSLSERVESLRIIIESYCSEKNIPYEKITAKRLSDLTGMSQTQARRYIMILQSRPEVREAIQSKRLENIKLIELICSAKESEHQDELIESAKSGATFNTVFKLKKMLEEQGKILREKRGRKKNMVNLGRVTLDVSKSIFEALLSSCALENRVFDRIQAIYTEIQWHDMRSVENAFKQVVLLLEKGN